MIPQTRECCIDCLHGQGGVLHENEEDQALSELIGLVEMNWSDWLAKNVA